MQTAQVHTIGRFATIQCVYSHDGPGEWASTMWVVNVWFGHSTLKLSVQFQGMNLLSLLFDKQGSRRN